MIVKYFNDKAQPTCSRHEQNESKNEYSKIRHKRMIVKNVHVVKCNMENSILLRKLGVLIGHGI